MKTSNIALGIGCFIFKSLALQASSANIEISGVSQIALSKGASAIEITETIVKKSDPITSINWAGAAKHGSNITSATGTFVVPPFALDQEGFPTGMAVWVGIDGFTCPDRQFIAGIIIAAQKGYDAESHWVSMWAWQPDYLNFNNVISFAINEGDKIRLSIQKTSDTSGISIVENLTTGKNDTKAIEVQTPLCGLDASFVVSDYTSLGRPIRFLDFLRPVTFTEASAITGSGDTLDLKDAQLINIEQNGFGRMTDCKLVGTAGLTCSRVKNT